MAAEGWFQDPYGRPADRWFSDGQPTQLVRDGEAESHDPPPAAPVPDVPLVRSTRHGSERGSDDLRRADQDDEAHEDPNYGAVGEDVITRSMPTNGL